MVDSFAGINNSRSKRIKAILALKGITQSQIAQEAGVHRTMVSNFIHRGYKSQNVFNALMKKGVPVRYLIIE